MRKVAALLLFAAGCAHAPPREVISAWEACEVFCAPYPPKPRGVCVEGERVLACECSLPQRPEVEAR